MPDTNYSVREWLNPLSSEATGSVVAFDGMVQRRQDTEPHRFTFLEVADCNGKVNLHKMPMDGSEAFVEKMRLLAKVVTEFADYLEKGEQGMSDSPTIDEMWETIQLERDLSHIRLEHLNRLKDGLCTMVSETTVYGERAGLYAEFLLNGGVPRAMHDWCADSSCAKCNARLEKQKREMSL